MGCIVTTINFFPPQRVKPPCLACHPPLQRLAGSGPQRCLEGEGVKKEKKKGGQGQGGGGKAEIPTHAITWAARTAQILVYVLSPHIIQWRSINWIGFSHSSHHDRGRGEEIESYNSVWLVGWLAGQMTGSRYGRDEMAPWIMVRCETVTLVRFLFLFFPSSCGS